MDDLALLSLNDEGEVITEIKKPTPWKKNIFNSREFCPYFNYINSNNNNIFYFPK